MISLSQNLQPWNRIATPRPAAGSKAQGPQDRIVGDWRDQLADYGKHLQARQDLGLLSGRQNADALAAILADETPTSNLKVIADRAMAGAGMLGTFPDGVLKDVEAAKEFPKSRAGVVDLRHLPMVSVDNGELDPATGKLLHESKDIDQCDYAEKLPRRQYPQIGGHCRCG